jgi:hypothetical protein
MVLGDLEEFVTDHRAHGRLEPVVGDVTPNGLIEVACACGVTFCRWVPPIDAAIDLALMAKLN